MMQYFEPTGGKKSMYAKMKRRNEQLANQKRNILDLCIVQEVSLLGDEDIYVESDEHRYMASAECISPEAELYMIKKEDFLKACK